MSSKVVFFLSHVNTTLTTCHRIEWKVRRRVYVTLAYRPSAEAAYTRPWEAKFLSNH